MPHTTATQKRLSRRRIVDAAAGSFRRVGLDAPLRTVMERAGMTNGALYRHFGSKEDLVRETLESVFETSRGRWEVRLAGLEGRERIEAMVAHYLSDDHTSDVDNGCPVPCILTELSRVPEPLRVPFARYEEEIIAGVATHLAGDPATRDARATGIVTLCIGAVASARAADTPERRSRILEGARKACSLLIDG